ncbi:MAG: TlpA family protein disulfide reductase [Planctomycetes bacterium]|nr:TlpA family protein disulfide reductase [Planctomycetota bacterium]
MTEKYAKDGLVVLAVNSWDEPKRDLERFAKDKSLKQRILINGSEVAEKYHVSRYPTSVWVNRQGVVVDCEIGSSDASTLEQKTKKLLAGG